MGGINAAGSTVQFNNALKLLVVRLDASLSFDKHLTNIVHTCTSTHARYSTFVHRWP